MVAALTFIAFFAGVLLLVVLLALAQRNKPRPEPKRKPSRPLVTYHKIGCRKGSDHTGRCY
jgi:hypothetical protein